MLQLKLAVVGSREDAAIVSIAGDATIQDLYAIAAKKFDSTTSLTLKAGWPPRPLTGNARIDSVLKSQESVLVCFSHSSSTTKRPLSKSSPSLNSASANKKVAATIPSPFKLFQTDEDRHSTNPSVQEHCLSLRQMLGFDKHARFHMDMHTTIDWLCISNFMIDFQFLLQTIPELVSIPVTTVFYQDDCMSSPGMNQWKAAANNVSFVRLDPRAEPRQNDPHSSNPLRYKFRWGCHHTKMFLLGRNNGTLRVIVHTSNLLPFDTRKANGAFIQDFPLKAHGALPSSQFEDDLVDYLTTYDYHHRQPWNGQTSTTLCEELRRYDFSGAKGVLIASTPGYYDLGENGTSSDANNRGYLKLSRAIRENCPDASPTAPIVCQFSSVGALSVKYLQSFVSALRPTPCTRLEGSLKLVFPTPECIRNSVEGYQGGGTVPSKTANVNKPFLRGLWHKWVSNDDSNPLLKPQHVPHIKSYYQQYEDSNDMQWFCLTSHNMSKAAWGECRTNDRGSHLYVMHWELGVFTAPSLWNDHNNNGRMGPVKTADSPGRLNIPLPYAVNPTPYGPQEEPFSWEKSYPGKPDAFGRVSTAQ